MRPQTMPPQTMRKETEERIMPMSASSAETLQDQVIVANKEFYKQIARKYDDYEACASDAFFQRWIEDDLKIVEHKLPKRGDAVRCLDCGGGTGNVTLKMLRRGWRVTVVDVSADMLAILERKVRFAGSSATFLNQSVESFFSRSEETFDLISFSSVLHHLYSPLNTIKAAAERISPQGFFYSSFDPVLPPPNLPPAASLRSTPSSPSCFTTAPIFFPASPAAFANSAHPATPTTAKPW